MGTLRTSPRKIAIAAAVLSLFLPIRMDSQPARAANDHRVLALNRMPFTHLDSQAAGWIQMQTAIGDDYFDGTSSVERVRRHLKAAQQMGVRYLRCGFSWNAIEKAQGEYDWRFWDMLVQEANRAHIELVPYVAYTPRWAASADEQFWSRPPRDDIWYSDFMYRAVSRYRGKVHSWEIWNEPDNREYWQGTVDAYAQLVTHAAMRMREADPSIVLVLGGMSRGPSDFFRELLDKFHVDRYVDVIAVHGYPETWGEERVEHVYHDWVPEMAELIQRQGSGVDFWANELGYADFRFSPAHASKWGGSVFYKYEHTRDYAAEFLFKSEVMALASGRLSLAGWYRIDDFRPGTPHVSDDEVNFHLGLFDSQGDAKPAFYALKFFNMLFKEPVQHIEPQISRPPHSQSDVEIFRKRNGQLILIGWLRSSERSEVENKTGELTDFRAENVAARLPCRALSGLQDYDVEGRPHPDHVSFTSHALEKIQLRGDRVFIAVANCLN